MPRRRAGPPLRWLVAAAAVAAAAAAAAAQQRSVFGTDSKDETYRDLGPGETFACADGDAVGGGASVQFERVNDGMCDCRDGSDEPGTGACQGDGGRFFCANAGFKPESLFSSRVNDGFCDCCDGSDEYGDPRLCENTCAAAAAVWNVKADAWAAVVTAGIAAKQAYIEEGAEAFGTLKKHLREVAKAIKRQTNCADAKAAAAAVEAGELAEEAAAASDGEGEDAEAGEQSVTDEAEGGDGEEETEEVAAVAAVDASSCEVDEKRLEYLLGKQKELRNHITVFGPDFAWYPLAQRCVEFNKTRDAEYIYGTLSRSHPSIHQSSARLCAQNMS